MSNDNYVSNENGNIKISEEVISIISSISAQEVEGIASLGTSGGTLSEILTKKSQGKGVKVELVDGEAVIDIHITVKFGTKIRDIAYAIQDHVKNAVETMASLSVRSVNVFVDAVEITKSTAVEDAAE